MENTMINKFAEQSDEQSFFEPILEKKECQVRITNVEHAMWEVKKDDNNSLKTAALEEAGLIGKKFNALKIELEITDEDVRCEHEDAKPSRTVNTQFNTEQYPYFAKKDGVIKKLGRAQLYQIEEAFGFEPVFIDGSGQVVEAHVTKTGRKVAPKVEGVKRRLNPDFLGAYFEVGTDDDGNDLLLPVSANWIGRDMIAHIGVESSEQYGNKNIVKAFKGLIS